MSEEFTIIASETLEFTIIASETFEPFLTIIISRRRNMPNIKRCRAITTTTKGRNNVFQLASAMVSQCDTIAGPS
jgi:hypothetical protein